MNTKNLIERYVYDVTRRLNKNEREDVRLELLSNINDMLPENYTEENIIAVLKELGSPVDLADKYRHKPQYLISPRMYDLYIRTIKIVLPIVGIVLAVIGTFTSLKEAVSSGADGSKFVSSIIAGALSTGFEGVLQVLFWTTLGFFIADRTGASEDEWDISELPDEIPNEKSLISLSDGIVDGILTIIFTALLITVCTGYLPVTLYISDYNVHVTSIFNEEFLKLCLPFVIICGVTGILESIVKILYRRWNIPVCCAVIIGNITWYVSLIYIITRDNIFNDAFVAVINDTALQNSFDIIDFIAGNGFNPIVIFISVCAGIGVAVTCICSVYKTIRAYRM